MRGCSIFAFRDIIRISAFIRKEKMTITTTILTILVAFEFFYIMYLETIATTSAKTSKTFNIKQKQLEDKNLNTLLKNQGVYNGLIGIGLIYGLFFNQGIIAPILVYIVSVATYGAITSDKKIILTQGGLAIFALVLIFMGV